MLDPGSCTHGVTFDEEAADKLLRESPKSNGLAAFIMGNPASEEVRKRWPRGWFTDDKPCASCGFVGIAYASSAHYAAGDW